MIAALRVLHFAHCPQYFLSYSLFPLSIHLVLVFLTYIVVSSFVVVFDIYFQNRETNNFCYGIIYGAKLPHTQRKPVWYVWKGRESIIWGGEKRY